MLLTAAQLNEIRALRKTIGLNIRALRTAKGLTLRKFSTITGIPINRLDLYEIGRHDISLHVLYRIASVFNVEVASLLSTPEQKDTSSYMAAV